MMTWALLTRQARDVIDFVSRLRGTDDKEAALMLAQNFSIPYKDGRNTGK